MDSTAFKLLWIGTCAATGLAVLIALLTTVGALPKWSLVSLVTLGGLSFSFTAIGLEWVRFPPKDARSVIIVALIWIFMGVFGVVSWPKENSTQSSVRPGQELYAEVLGSQFEAFYQFYGHPPAYFKELDTGLYVSITNQTDYPIYLRDYFVSAFVKEQWIDFKNADPGGYESDQFGIMGPVQLGRFDLSRNGFDYVMRQRPLAAHESVKLWMFLASGLGQDSIVGIDKFKIILYDSTNKQYICMASYRKLVVTMGTGESMDLRFLGWEPKPKNLRPEP